MLGNSNFNHLLPFNHQNLLFSDSLVVVVLLLLKIQNLLLLRFRSVSKF
jgi:hypothetical protein